MNIVCNRCGLPSPGGSRLICTVLPHPGVGAPVNRSVKLLADAFNYRVSMLSLVCMGRCACACVYMCV